MYVKLEKAKGGLLKKILFYLSLASLVLLPAIAQAGFNQDKVIEDEAFTNTSSMSAVKIQQFLDDQKSVLGKFSEEGRSAAGIIYDAAQANGLNPQVIIATLQKEQGLITLASYDTVSDPSGKLRKAMGYACPDSGGCDSKYAGFTKQIDGAAFQLRYNFDGSLTRKFQDYQVNQTMTFDGTAVFLTNRATASLYRYTPHISGNRSFYNFFFANFLDYSSHWVGQNSFPILAPGDSYQFVVKFENIGNKSWDQNIIKLGTDQPKDRVPKFFLENRLNGDPTMWSKNNRIGLNESSVAPGQVGSFSFYETIPPTMPPGVYKEYFRPVADGISWLDDDRVYWGVTVANHHATWAGQNFGVKRVEPGESFQLEVKLRNAGQTTWRRDGATPVRLGTDRSLDRTPLFIREDKTGANNPSGWATANRVSLVEPTVAPGEIGTFRFWYTVPAGLAAGTYREYFRPVHDNVGWLEDLGIYFDITVGVPQASWAGQSDNPTLSKGQSAKLTVNFRNTGTSTWKKAGDNPIRLATFRPSDRLPKFIRDDLVGHNPSGWLTANRVALVQDSVAPGETGTFTFYYSVPDDKQPGTYREYFDLVAENFGLLADQGVYWDITVQ